MYLKRLEVHGFKSFAERIDMNFESGITGVVGPNGSGKSNISDSIRWVLGEQSPKSLRGSKMEDVIFAGTTGRRPLGMAEVSLTLDNGSQTLPTDYGEVTITRRVYRSGESEYYLNKSLCRLKDIRELLMDTGIGKEGYSIIGQGKIDEILNSKPEERRLIFEEAAGIIKYKTRRDESEKKLKATEENLLRVADILFELKNQLEPLRKQSQKAEQYQELKARLLTLEVNLFIREIDKLDGELKHLTEQSEVIQLSLQEQQADKARQLEKIEAVKAALVAWEQAYEVLLKVFHQMENQIKEESGSIVLKQEKLSHNRSNRERIEAELSQLETLDHQAEERLAGRRLELEQVHAQLEALQQELETASVDQEARLKQREAEERDLEGLKGEIIDFLNQIADKKSEMNSLKTLIQTMEDRLTQIQKEGDHHRRVQEEKAGALETLAQEQAAFDRQQAENDLQIKSAEDLLGRLEQQLNRESTQFEAAKNRYQQQLSRKNLLEELEREHDGFNKSVKNILTACEKNPALGKGVHGVVADLLTVPKGYEIAIETGLGSSIQNIVCETEEDGKRLIDHMKQRNLGRITLLPLSALQKRELSHEEQQILRQFPEVQVAYDLVKTAPQFQHAFSNLLGRVLIAPTLEVGIQVARRLQYRLKIVTVEGDQLNIGGSMTGGSLPKSGSGILGRKRELEDLKASILQEKAQLEQQQQALEKTRQTQEKERQQLAGLQSQGQQLQIQAVTLKNRKEQLENEATQHRQAYEQLDREKNQLTQVRSDAQVQLESKQQEIQETESTISHTQAGIQARQSRLQADRQQLEALSGEMTQKKVQAASVEGIKNTLLQEMDQLQQAVGQRVQQRKKMQQSLAEIARQAEELTVAIREEEAGLQELKTRAAEQESRLSAEKDTKLSILQQETELKAALEHHEKLTADLQESMHRLDLKRTRLEMQQQSAYNRLWEEYELTYQTAQEHRVELEDYGKANREIKQYKEEIKALGTVNVEAIETYRQVKERHGFLRQQQDDLLQAKASLSQVIEEMEKHMEKQFAEQFQLIRGNFNQVFVKLFGGGKADLVLETEGDMLNSGIDIIAQPPGKKLQNLSLLSGGERALTAISLLFAILLVKPSPFCILDEIEAALDDANVNRFAYFLRDLAETTQFIVVTHRKGTMEIANVLYGVTMEEEGISKIVSVKLSDQTKTDQEAAVAQA